MINLVLKLYSSDPGLCNFSNQRYGGHILKKTANFKLIFLWHFQHLFPFRTLIVIHNIACEQAHVGAQARGEAARRETFLAPLHQTSLRRIALLFTDRARDSNVSLLAGYTQTRILVFKSADFDPEYLDVIRKAIRMIFHFWHSDLHSTFS